MCWSGEASAVLATIGIGTTLYAAYKGEPKVLWITLGYFSLMELLQAFTYAYINDCAAPENQIATLFGYLHIAFQPFFINALSMFFIADAVRRKIELPVYTLCFISTIIMLIQLYPFPGEWAGQCDIGTQPMCAETLCSVDGNWHIAWDVPVNGTFNFLAGLDFIPIYQGYYPSYFFVAFLLPIFYGSWRFTLYHIAFGPMLSYALTDNPNEWPAVWCLLSIAILLIVVKTPVREYLHVRRWIFWPKSLFK
jgi:hypothetical protein